MRGGDSTPEKKRQTPNAISSEKAKVNQAQLKKVSLSSAEKRAKDARIAELKEKIALAKEKKAQAKEKKERAQEKKEKALEKKEKARIDKEKAIIEKEKAQKEVEELAKLAEKWRQQDIDRKKEKEKAELQEKQDKEAKAKRTPVKPPRLVGVVDDVSSKEYDYLDLVLRKINDVAGYVEINGKKQIYYSLKGIQDIMKEQIDNIRKDKESEGYKFPDEARRKFIIAELNNYIKYFEYEALGDRVFDKYFQALFKDTE